MAAKFPIAEFAHGSPVISGRLLSVIIAKEATKAGVS